MSYLLIFGGTGSLGYKLVEKFSTTNDNIVIISRDEWKQARMKAQYPNLTFEIGDVRDAYRVKEIIKRYDCSVIINCAAMKHIDRCEYDVREAYMTNCIGMMNIANAVDNQETSVVFVSTDKACQPVNTYGATKLLAEKVISEHRFKYKKNFSIVRYGNVLNSRGSILPVLREIGENSLKKEFHLTHPEMTRFLMTQDQAVDLIQKAILNNNNCELFIPMLKSMRIKDLVELFSEKYQKPIKIIGQRRGEKLHELLINDSNSNNVDCEVSLDDINKFNSEYQVISKDELKKYLIENNLF